MCLKEAESLGSLLFSSLTDYGLSGTKISRHRN
jgi:hypothetical protein